MIPVEMYHIETTLQGFELLSEAFLCGVGFVRALSPVNRRQGAYAWVPSWYNEIKHTLISATS